MFLLNLRSLIANRIPKMNDTDLASIIKYYCNCGHILGLCPFRLATDKKNGKILIVKTWWPQRIFCGLIALLIFMYLVGIVRTGWVTLVSERKHPLPIFKYGLNLCYIIFVSTIMRLLWFGNCKFAVLANLLANKENQFDVLATFKIKMELLTTFVLSVLAPVLIYEFLAYDREIPRYWRNLYEMGHFILYFEKFPQTNATDIGNATQTRLDNFLPWLTLAMRIIG